MSGNALRGKLRVDRTCGGISRRFSPSLIAKFWTSFFQDLWTNCLILARALFQENTFDRDNSERNYVS